MRPNTKHSGIWDGAERRGGERRMGVRGHCAKQQGGGQIPPEATPGLCPQPGHGAMALEHQL